MEDRLYPWPAAASKERRATARVRDNALRAGSVRGRIGRGTKAKVEVAVQVAMRLIVPRLRNQQFFSLWELNAAIAPLVAQINNCVSHSALAAMRPFDPQSRLKHQLVTACGSNKDGRSGGIFFDFLPYPIDVCLERVRCDS
jgi:hypothetical protein